MLQISFSRILRISSYWVASVGRIDKIIGLFCKRAQSKRMYSAKETYDLSILLTVATPYIQMCDMTCDITRDMTCDMTCMYDMTRMTVRCHSELCNNTLQKHTSTTHHNNTLQQHTATTHCNQKLQQGCSESPFFVFSASPLTFIRVA